jgi:hypothetical protein
MPSIIQAGNAASSGLVTAGATDGILELRSGTAVGGTVAMTVDAAQNIVLAKGISVGASAAPAFSAFLSANQAISPSTLTRVSINAKEFDTANAFDNLTNFRFTPLVAGYYQVNCKVNAEASTTASRTFAVVTRTGGSGAISKRAMDYTPNVSMGSFLFFMNGINDSLDLSAFVSGSGIVIVGGSDSTFLQAFLARSA